MKNKEYTLVGIKNPVLERLKKRGKETETINDVLDRILNNLDEIENDVHNEYFISKP